MNYQVQATALAGLTRKELSRFIRIWPQTLIPSAMTAILYFLIFGHVIGSRIGQMGGIPYIQFIAPGLVMMAVITNSYTNVVSSFYGARFQRSFEEILVSPMHTSTIIMGYLAGGMARGIIVGVVIFIVAFGFTHIHIEHIGLTLLDLVLCSLLFSLAGLLNGIFANKFDDTAIVPSFVLTPLIYFGGVFYNINLLPPFWHELSLFNPIYYIINLFRYSVFGLAESNYLFSYAIVVILITCLLSLNYHLIKKGIRIKS